MAKFRNASTGCTQPFDRFITLGNLRGTPKQRQAYKHRQKKKQRQYDRKLSSVSIAALRGE
jgi:hypothetical protein